MAQHIPLKPKLVTIGDLTAMTARGFENVEQRLGDRMNIGFERMEGTMIGLGKTMEEGFARIEGDFQHVNARLDQIRRDIADLDDLRERVAAIEIRIGLTRKK